MGFAPSSICSDFGPVSKQHIARYQIKANAELCTAAQYLLQSFFIGAPEFSYGFMVGLKPAYQPDKGDIVIACLFKLSGTLHPVGIPVHQKLSHSLWIIGCIADFTGVQVDTQGGNIKGLNKEIIGPHGIIGCHIFFYALRKQCCLITIAGSKRHGSLLSKKLYHSSMTAVVLFLIF